MDETTTNQLTCVTSYSARAIQANILRKNGFCNVLNHQYELYNSKTAFVRNEQGSGLFLKHKQ
jgi:hypothetical protein